MSPWRTSLLDENLEATDVSSVHHGIENLSFCLQLTRPIDHGFMLHPDLDLGSSFSYTCSAGRVLPFLTIQRQHCAQRKQRSTLTAPETYKDQSPMIT